ncbi:OLC1v1022653C1 [Oldenlandia corymbosa var. corymbosa]|nr:OLC1v1022653C1 [Oldenlandia corymbosa var. corymbosa]
MNRLWKLNKNLFIHTSCCNHHRAKRVSEIGGTRMSRLWARFKGLFSNRTMVGMDKAGNRYFAVTEELDGVMKEKRWVMFKDKEQEPTSIPVEWICWLNGQRKKAPTPEEMAELEARRERVRLNVALLKKEEEERKAREAASGKVGSAGKVAGPDLKSFIQQLPVASEVEGKETGEASLESSGFSHRNPAEATPEKKSPYQIRRKQEE